jgi:hypothetical protein
MFSNTMAVYIPVNIPTEYAVCGAITSFPKLPRVLGPSEVLLRTINVRALQTLTLTFHVLIMLLTLLSFCLLLLGQVLAQQCRLVAPQNLGATPAPQTSKISTASIPTQTVNIAASSSASTSPSGSSASSLPTLAAFNYGTDPIRGVNL